MFASSPLLSDGLAIQLSTAALEKQSQEQLHLREENVATQGCGGQRATCEQILSPREELQAERIQTAALLAQVETFRMLAQVQKQKLEEYKGELEAERKMRATERQVSEVGQQTEDLDEEAQAQMRARLMQWISIRQQHVRRLHQIAHLIGAWESWVDMWHRSRRSRFVLANVRHRWQSAELWKTFERWRAQAEELKAMAAKGNKVVMRWKRKTAAMCLEAWRVHSAEDLRKRSIMTKIVLRTWQRSVSQALDRWIKNLEELKTMAAKGNKVVMRWKRKTAAMCLEAWRVHSAEELRKRRIMTKIVLRTWQRSVSQALDRWMKAVEEVAAARAEEEQMRMIENLEERRAMAANERFLFGYLVTTSNSAVVRRILKYWQHRKRRALCGVWDAWIEHWRWARRARYVVKRASRRWRSAERLRAFERWRSKVKQLRRSNQALTHLIKHASRASLLRFWHRWIEGAQYFAHMQRVLNKAGCRLRNSLLTATLFGWRSNCRAQAEILTSMLLRCMRGSLLRAWNMWRVRTAKRAHDCRRVQVVLEKAARRLHNASLVKVLFLTSDFYVLQDLGFSCADTCIPQGFYSWLESADAHRRMRTGLHRVEGVIIIRMIKRWLQKDLFVAFRSWSDQSRREKRIEDVKFRIIKRWFQKYLFAAFNSWRNQSRRQLQSSNFNRLISTLGSARPETPLQPIDQYADMIDKHPHTLLCRLSPRISAPFHSWSRAASSSEMTKNGKELKFSGFDHFCSQLAFRYWLKMHELVDVALHHYHELTQHRFVREVQPAPGLALFDANYIGPMEDKANLKLLSKTIDAIRLEMPPEVTKTSSWIYGRHIAPANSSHDHPPNSNLESSLSMVSAYEQHISDPLKQQSVSGSNAKRAEAPRLTIISHTLPSRYAINLVRRGV
jgi:hypothetical protein